MILLVVDTQKLITNENLYKFKKFKTNIQKLIVPAYTNSTFDNQYMTAEETYSYYNDYMWNKRYAECMSMKDMIKRMKR